MSTAVAQEWTQELHDMLLPLQPDGTHHPADCRFCTATKEEPMATATADDAAQIATQIADAVEKATAPLLARISELEGAGAQAAQEQAIAAAVEAAVSPLNDKVAGLQADLDAAVARAVQAEKSLEDTTSYLEAEAATAAAEDRRDERVEAVRATALFDEDHLAKKADDWAAMTDEAWAEQLGEYQALAARYGSAPKAPAATPPVPDARTPLKATADPAGTARPESFARKAIRLRTQGIDTSSITG
jgi:hypothetical protein